MSYEGKIKNAAWETLGNTGLSTALNWLGTTDNVDLVVKTNNIEAMRILAANQNLGVGTSAPTAKVNISGANANAGANPLLRINDTNLANTSLSVDNGVNQDAYRFISLGAPASSSPSIELQSGSNSNQLVVNANSGVGFGVKVPQARVDVNGAVIFRPVVLADFPANAVIGTAAATVDVASTVHIAQSTASIATTLPPPTNTQAGRLLTVVNTGTADITVDGQKITPMAGQAFEWDGTAWVPVGSPPPTPVDFWRSGTGATLPDNTTDTTDSIAHDGKVLVGAADPSGIIAALEVAGGRNNTGALPAGVAAGDIAFVYGANVGHRNFISSEHDSATDGNNRINLWLNKAGAPGASSAPGVGNQSPLSITAVGSIFTNGSVNARTLNAAAALDVAGAGVLRPVSLADYAANGVLGTAAATVDIASSVTIPQATPNIVVTIPAPTNTQAGRLLTVLNDGSVDVTVGGQKIAAGTGQAFMWDGATWIPVGSPPAAPAWQLLGNAGTVAGTNFMGTTDAQDVEFRANNRPVVRIKNDANNRLMFQHNTELFNTIGSDDGDNSRVFVGATEGTSAADIVTKPNIGFWGNSIGAPASGTVAITTGVSASGANRAFSIFTSEDGVSNRTHMVMTGNGDVRFGKLGSFATPLLPNNKVEITSDAADTSGLRFTNLTSASPQAAAAALIGVDANGDVVIAPPASKKYCQAGIALVANTAFTITHNLALTAGNFDCLIFQARDAAGNSIDLRASNFTANSFDVKSPVAITIAKIVVMA